MNTALLKLAKRHKTGARIWLNEGLYHPIRIVPAQFSFLRCLSVSYPRDFKGGPALCRLALPLNRPRVKNDLREIISRLQITVSSD